MSERSAAAVTPSTAGHDPSPVSPRRPLADAAAQVLFTLEVIGSFERDPLVERGEWLALEMRAMARRALGWPV